jgi:SAM-dependent methyltransferase
MPAARDDTHFGRRTVPLQDKQGLVDDVFHKVAGRYDVMNDLMSFGLHRAWKDALVARVRPSLTRPFAHVDVAGGTGDVAMRVADAGGPLTTVTLVDVNPDMLGVAEERAAKRSFSSRLTFVEANAEIRASTPIRSRLASATCRGSKPPSAKPIGCSSAAGVSCASNSRASICRWSSESTTLIRSPRSRPWARS